MRMRDFSLFLILIVNRSPIRVFPTTLAQTITWLWFWGFRAADFVAAPFLNWFTALTIALMIAALLQIIDNRKRETTQCLIINGVIFYFPPLRLSSCVVFCKQTRRNVKKISEGNCGTCCQGKWSLKKCICLMKNFRLHCLRNRKSFHHKRRLCASQTAILMFFVLLRMNGRSAWEILMGTMAATTNRLITCSRGKFMKIFWKRWKTTFGWMSVGSLSLRARVCLFRNKEMIKAD